MVDGTCGANIVMDDQLKILFDYTKFHIGMYGTLLVAVVGVLGKKELRESFGDMAGWLKYSAVCLLVAGAAGGLIASSIPFYTTFDEFKRSSLGPWNLQIVPAVLCTHIEHLFFWFGIIVAVVGAWKSKAAK